MSESKVSIVTGALGALGRPIAVELAKKGHRVILMGRGKDRLEALRREIAASTDGSVDFVECDFASLRSVRAAATQIARRHPRIDVLVNNAAVYSGTRKVTVDGHELMFATNHLAPYLLTRLLEPQLVAAKSARVICMAMPSKKAPRLDDLMSERSFGALDAFMRSKATSHYFVRELAARWVGKVAVYAVNPDMTKTTLVREAPLPLRIVFALFGQSPEKAIAPAIYAATSSEAVSGAFYSKKGACPFMPESSDEVARARLWDASAQLVGLVPAIEARAVA